VNPRRVSPVGQPASPTLRRGWWKPPRYGGTPTALPLVATVGVNNLTPTGVNLIGSVNPQGLAGTAWFAYGTTPQFGSVTGTQTLAANSIPQTLTATLTGLSTGVEYWFAMVGQTAGGTVTAPPVTFTPQIPQVVTNASQPTVPTGTPAVSVPHYRFPVAFNTATGVGAVEQDTLDEVFSNVQMIAACPQGACPELPNFGVPSLAFGQAPLDPSPLVAAIQQQEPRATEQAVSQQYGDPDGGAWLIALTTTYAGSGQ